MKSPTKVEWMVIVSIVGLFSTVCYLASVDPNQNEFFNQKITDISVYEFFVMMWLVLFLSRGKP